MDLYPDLIIDEYKHPQNRGKLSQPDLIVDGNNASCGDRVKIYLKFKNSKIKNIKKMVADIAWEGDGCVISQVAMSRLSQKIKEEGLTLTQVAKMEKQDMLKLLGLEEISAGREKCLMMGVRAVRNIKFKN